MASTGRNGVGWRRLAVGAAVVAVAALLGPVSPARSVSGPRSTYIVEVASPPRAGGGITALVDRTVDSVLSVADAAAAPVLHRYREAFSGFAARLTAAEAADLARTPGVVAVTPDTVSRPLAVPAPSAPGPSPGGTTAGPETADFLGLPGGLWDRLGGPGRAGEGVTIGVIDTGINPEHPSFADTPAGPDGSRYDGPAYGPPTGWKGTCQTGEEFSGAACNHKLIGARWFVEGFGAGNVAPGEFLSPRDANGHGSHVAATAAGNSGVVPAIGGHDLGIAALSGIAPRARIAAYKVCWTGTKAGGEAVEGSCMASDAVAAIDAAVADGVDVINYSVGSAGPAVFGPVERAFLGAAAAGVFVANAAGNDGPGPGTVGSPTGVPWVTSVAATTLPRRFESTFSVTPAGAPAGTPVRPFSGTGRSLTGALADAPLVDSAAVAVSPARVADAALCLPGSLDPAAVAGRAVVCQRGENARVEKGRVVHDAGGVGMVLVNTKPDEDVVADLHWVPAVHVSAADGAEIRVLVAGAPTPARLSLGGGRPVAGPGDQVAAFSSRGPEAAVPDIAKPDIGAPGVDILAAGTPTPATGDRPGESFQLLSGTSMASPQVAGAAALLAQLQPGWSPAAIKSALMTTAESGVLREDGRSPAGPHDVGSGRIDPNRAADPGLVVDTPVPDYLRYLEGQDPDLVADTAVTPLAAGDLNVPSVAVSQFTGRTTTVRTFTSVDDRTQSWRATVESPDGILAAVTPARFDIAPGATQAVTLSLTLGSAVADVYSVGALRLTNAADGRTVRLPVSIRPVRLAVERRVEVAAAGAAGTAPLPVRPGFAGSLSALGWGLAPPRPEPGLTVATAVPGTDQPWAPSAGVRTWDVDVPSGAQLLAAEITARDAAGPPSTVDGDAAGTDLDLYVFRDDNGDGYDAADLLGLSAGPGADESVAALLPAAGVYRIAVVGFRTPGAGATFDFTTWLGTDAAPDDAAVPAGGPGLVVDGDPRTVNPGETAELRLGWSGVEADGAYLGLVTYHDEVPPQPQAPAGLTLVRVVRGQVRPVVPAIVSGPAPGRLGPAWAPSTIS
ncbi:MAG TPA: S8 family serine peptidase [Acidimicrobiia bacterium]|nr:S8 family serine peptidase [Acidimicrobiia bacterium]